LLSSPAHVSATSKLAMHPHRPNIRRTAIGVVSGILHKLIGARDEEIFAQPARIIRFENPLLRVMQSTIANQKSDPARRELIPVLARKPVRHRRNPERVARSRPPSALHRNASRNRAIDLREHPRLRPAIVPTGPE